MKSWFLNSHPHSNDQSICVKSNEAYSDPDCWILLAKLLVGKVKVSYLQLFRVHIAMSRPHFITKHSLTPTMTLHWPHNHITQRIIKITSHRERIIKISQPATKQRIRERDLHVCAPRLPWHNWVLPGGPGFPDTDIPQLLLTNHKLAFWSRDLTQPIRG